MLFSKREYSLCRGCLAKAPRPPKATLAVGYHGSGRCFRRQVQDDLFCVFLSRNFFRLGASGQIFVFMWIKLVS